ncbi:MBL fold metallo-hydrolase [Acuticoccus sediminis]|uniref:MBL fold metallo-hydrolase n=1 Tax=Acuticoccus sediminis TaxID=2184697 RepID=A0A8B2NTA2_9HYPH|nr:MBL fold metallo-hydrolase [Acuticoccus sediminis]RAI01749.1 MBL fold metallo-hydrolase [Acuticoccus sediminis]
MLPTEQIPGVYHRKVGDILVTALTDGYLDAGYGIFHSVSADEAASILDEGREPSPPRISVNMFLVRGNGRTALVDTGSSDCMGDTLGLLPQSLAAAGVTPEEIDTILLTHMHPDHSAGLLTPEGKVQFPNAEVVVGEADYALWHDDAAMASTDERRRMRYFEWSRKQIAPYRDRLVWAEGDVMPGVTTVPLPGHTPGHCGYLIHSGNDSMLVWGDTVHVPGVQVPRPEASMVFDWEPDRAVESRRRVFDMVASENTLVAGMHIHFPGFGRMIRTGDGYRLVPEAWTFTL